MERQRGEGLHGMSGAAARTGGFNNKEYVNNQKTGKK